MAMDVGGAKGGIKSDINVTPLVDVMLVLLIIMMIVAPLLQKGAPVRLPTAANSVDKPETQDQTVVAVTADGRMHLNGIPQPDTELPQRIQDTLETKKEKVVYLKADQDASYGRVMAAFDALRKAPHEAHAAIPVVVVSAAMPLADEAHRLHGCRVLKKPLDIELLIDIVRSHCRAADQHA